MRVRVRCQNCRRAATCPASQADLLYFCERCMAEYTGLELVDCHLGENAPRARLTPRDGGGEG